MINQQLCLSLKNPIFRGHKAYGQELLPGLAYIDLIFQIFQKYGYSYRELELRNLSIYNPLTVGQDYDVLLSIGCSEIKPGQWQVLLAGQEQRGGTLAAEKIRYVTAEMQRSDVVEFGEKLDLHLMKQGAKRIVSLDEMYAQCRDRELVHSGVMKAVGEVYESDDAVFVDITAPRDTGIDAGGFMFHPVLIDGSVIGARGAFSSLVKGESRLFLPLYYESFTASALLQERCIARVKSSSVRRKNELLYITMEFFNETGEKVGELKNFINKLVRDAGSINPHRQKSLAATGSLPVKSSSNQVKEVKESDNEMNTAGTATPLIEVESFLRQLLADRLEKPLDQIETNAGYYEMGLDSPRLLEVVQVIEAKVGTPLPPTLLFEYTTIKELAAYLTENYASKFAPPNAANHQIKQNLPNTTTSIKSFCGVQGRFFQKEPLAAVIGMAGRYPGAKNLREFWKNLTEGKDCITEIPKSRWDWQWYEKLKSPSGKPISRWGGFLDDVDCFDAEFFRTSPLEAEVMDPQERLFLETCWQAIEDAGYTPKTLVLPRGPNNRMHVGVFVGVMHKDYTLVGAEAVSRGQEFLLSLNYAPIANRVSYFCNFHGPSMAIDTVCSSSLTALHLALESINRGESEAALAGGVNLSLHPGKYMTYGMMDMHSSDGYCHAFGKGGDGYVSGEGVGVVLLKPLHRAIADRDRIYAVIKGSTINHGGKVSGLTVPNPTAQADMIRECLEKTGIHPRTISCIEAHGTGTSLGDPIEMQGLEKAFRLYTRDRQFCSIGSLKSNIGHAESAAGIAGLTKVVLQLYHKTLVPSLHAEELNPYIDFQQSPFYIQRQTGEWKQPVVMEDGRRDTYPRRAGLSSFGATGANAHVIVEEYLPRETSPQIPAVLERQAGPVIVPLSARNKERLNAYAGNLLDFLLISCKSLQEKQNKEKTGNGEEEINLADLAYTLQVGREAMAERVVFIVKEIPQLVQQLEAFIQNKDHIENCYRGEVKRDRETLALLTGDEDSKELIQKWIAKGRINRLAELWAKGLDLDWELLYGDPGESRPRRIGLPTYPFAGERYWVPVQPGAAVGTVGDFPVPPRESAVAPAGPVNAAAGGLISAMMFYPGWNRQESVDESAAVDIDYSRRLVILCEPGEKWKPGTREAGKESEADTLAGAETGKRSRGALAPLVKTLEVQSSKETAAQRFQYYALRLFEEIREIMKNKPEGKVLIQVVVCNQGEQQLYSGLSGLLKSAGLENPQLMGQLIEVEPGEDWPGIAAKLEENSRFPFYSQVRYREGKRWTFGWTGEEFSREAVNSRLPWKEQGVYLITGGTGGLGLIFAREILLREKKVTLVLTGRSPLNRLSEEKQAQLKELETLVNGTGTGTGTDTDTGTGDGKGKSKGTRVHYRALDVTEKKAVVKLIRGIEKDFGGLHGILHSAGVIRDSFILKKDKDHFLEVLGPKVSGLVNLDEATRELGLDFFVVFSSTAGVFGNLGQADYAAANAFMDAFAVYRNGLVAAKQRQGQTLSINWPLWKQGGMHVDEETEKIMEQRTGMKAMQTSTGIQAFYQSLASLRERVMVMEGDPARMQAYVRETIAAVHLQPTRESIPAADREQLLEKTINQLKVLLAEVTRLNPEKIDAQEALENYGIDSIIVTQLNQKLGAVFGELSKTLFYEYQTLGSLAGYLAAEYTRACMQWTGMENHPSQITGYKQNTNPGQDAHIDDTSNKMFLPGEPGSFLHKRAPGLHGGRRQEPLAIIGVSGRFPGAKNLEAYWENLQAGKNCITEIPRHRWDWREYYHEDTKEAAVLGKSYSKWGGFLDEFDRFDPLFFNMTPREAENIDPQERLFLEECWKALEDAGYAPSKLPAGLRARTGIFAGITKQGFNLYGAENGDYLAATSFSSAANRVSYYLNLQGPSIPVDTMCSSALTAIHEAGEYIRGGRGEMAIAGGVNLYLHPASYITLSVGQILSDSARCAAFAKGGTGFVPGEGVGAVVLKSLDRAIQDGDNIYAVIRGTAVNHDGKTNGYTTPNPLQQSAVIQQALDESQIDPRTISYIEAAASGSEMGDAIEMTALTQVFSNRTGTTGNYRIGSVKPNIGHCESASGMSQLFKVIGALTRETLVSTLMESDLNPNINFDRLPFQLQREVSPWEPVTVDGTAVPRRAGITGIGAGGVNAHIIVEEYIPDMINSRQLTHPSDPVLFVLSAKNRERLEDYAGQWVAYLQKNTIHPQNTAYTLQAGREEMPCRLAVVFSRQEELLQRLEQWCRQRENTDYCYFGDLNNKEPIDNEDTAREIKEKNLPRLATLWVQGNSIPWHELYDGKKLSRTTGLPTYPFARRRCWPGKTNKAVEFYNPGTQNKTVSLQEENKAVEFYTLGAQTRTASFQEDYLTFCPFEEKVPGFSMSRVFMNPEKYPEQFQLMKAKQIELRQVLFCKVDFNRIHALLDFGCGHGTDVIQIAALYPHMQTHGFTITRAQADLGNQRITQLDLGSRAKIFHRDSSKDAFPGVYDVIIGIEVSFHIRNKEGLFQNIDLALREDGKVLLMDFIANLPGPIIDPSVEASVPTQQDWIDLLSKHHLFIEEIIDVSPQIANFLYDPEVEENTKNLPEVARQTLKSYANQNIALEKGWIIYCLIKLKKDTGRGYQELRAVNTVKISNKTAYPAALAEMFRVGHIPYPVSGESFSLGNPGIDSGQSTGRSAPPPGLPQVKEILSDIFVNVLGLQRSELEEAKNFKEIGVGSVNTVQLLIEINIKFNLKLPTSIMFEYNNPDSLAVYIEEQIQKNAAQPPAPAPVPMPTVPGAAAIQNQNRESYPYANRKVREESFYEQRNQSIRIDLKKYPGNTPDDIAVIGLSCRCAGAGGPGEFWDLVSQGKDCIREIKNKKWLDFFKHHSSKAVPTRYGAMAEIEYFDPLFFNISPKEAASMDETQRILLQECYKALEDAGCTPSLLKEQAVATFIGTMGNSSHLQDFSHFSMLGIDTSILASRIAYFLDLKGPALAVNTACSSSLVAMDIACQKLKNHEIHLAIAGGITIYNHPAAFIAMNNAGMLSPTGECRPFDNEANGIVVGDGVGIVILKRLAEAERDNDHIYGVIRGIGTNQDGQTSGITVPSFLAQSQLEKSVYKKSRINVEDIQYIETHGTATKLGDPVEIHALNHAFEEFTARKRFCAIGSLKANIGHTTAAAGVLGVIKVLLSMKFKQIPPSINFVKENEHIDFAGSPFFVNTSLNEWPGNSRGTRLAAVSSFGFSGTNAHLLLEEYQPAEAAAAPPPQIKLTGENSVTGENSAAGEKGMEPAIIVLSARNKERLRQRAQQLLAAVAPGSRHYPGIRLTDIAYTLQVGREAMEERLATVVDSIEELQEKLGGFLEGRKDIKNLYQGQAKRNQDTMAVFTADEDLDRAIDAWAAKRKYGKILDLWVKGLSFDWNKLYRGSSGAKPRRTGLPTYPFARDSFTREIFPGEGILAEQVGSGRATASLAPGTFIHPLVQQNTSDFTGQRYSSTFTGREFFLAHHVIKGQRVLPAAAYLEMARAALGQAAGTLKENQIRVRLENIVWVQPLVVGEQPVRVHIGLYPDEQHPNQAVFEIYSESPAGDGEPVLHSQGSAVLEPVPGPGQAGEALTLDLETLQAECSRERLSSGQCYQAFQTVGVDYGPGHRAIETLYIGSGQVLAQLSLPAPVFDSHDGFGLHPGMLDAALQATAGIMIKPGMGKSPGSDLLIEPSLPFALEGLEIRGNCTANMWALVRYADGSAPGDKVRKLDIDISDQQGKVCVRLEGFSTRVLSKEVGLTGFSTAGPLLLRPFWKEQAIDPGAAAPDYSQHLVLLCEPGEGWTPGSWEAGKPGSAGGGLAHPVKTIQLQSRAEDIAERYQTYAARVFAEIRQILEETPKDRVLVQVVVFNRQEEQQLFTGLAGLLRTAGWENSKFIGQLIEVAPGENPQELAVILAGNSRCPMDRHIRCQGDKRWIASWNPVDVTRETAVIPWKDRGVYLVTGGAGGLGFIFAGEIVRHVKDAVVVLSGRTPLPALDRDRQTRLKELQESGAGHNTRIEYRQADVTQKEEISRLIRCIVRDFGGLQGIIHSAGVIRDNFTWNKTGEELQEVLAPKVKGLVYLDEASKDLDLDFFLLFSSVAGVLGNPGQVDYSCANAFMDAYARYRNALAAARQRRGQTLSINWPLWKEGGMQVDGEVARMLKQNLGMVPMETPVGIQALYQSLAVGDDQVMVMAGDTGKIKQKLLSLTTTTPTIPGKVPSPGSEADSTTASGLVDKVLELLKQTVSRLLSVKSEAVESDSRLSEYGFDSILLTEFANILNQEFMLELTPTIFFEHPTLQELAEYLLEEHRSVFAAKFAGPGGSETAEPARPNREEEIPTLPFKKQHPGFARRRVLASTGSIKPVPGLIAVVGMSGCFPMAADLHEFWENLKAGKDCITEIPKDRWDWRDYWGDPQQEANKTNIKWGGFIEGIDRFDSLFFGISPREAEFMDPQQRLLMTYVWKVIEDAGYSAQSLRGTGTGIFIGTGMSGYSELVSRSGAAIEGYSSTGMAASLGPNRMSYFLNLHGPSEPVETACSSSLVALHRAVETIAGGTCEMAIAGGVNTIVTPGAHISFSKAGMLCEDGRCKTFSGKANGYVRGEGVGMIFLKKLAAAEQDGDHIYGVIRAVAENHGGRANSLTAPNPAAQVELLKAAYTKAGIDPRTVTYIEAHGTGTKLGDPIEVNALKTAFQELYQAGAHHRSISAHCGLGSVKSNIGHLELAAGAAGVIKVLLQMKHKTLVKTLHCDTINPYIQLQGSPFYIVRETKAWQPLRDAQGRDLPRRAGVSSFGFGGVNAHVVLEEYIPRDIPGPGSDQRDMNTPGPAIIVLSGKDEERLRDRARQLFNFIAAGNQTHPDTCLSDIAYTLQVGREPMEERLAFLAGSTRELKEKLETFLESGNHAEGFYRGRVKGNKETPGITAADDDIQKAMADRTAGGKYTGLPELWVKGIDMDWNRLYNKNSSSGPRRISLPTYGFAGERCWVSGVGSGVGIAGTGPGWSASAAYIHPLLQQNTSDFREQRYSSIFTGREFFLADHVVKGRRVLPAVVYLEMARAAAAQAAGLLPGKAAGMKLKDVVWVQPLVCGDQPVRVHIGLFPGENHSEEIAFEIYSQPGENGAEPVLHCQGRVKPEPVCEEVPARDIRVFQTGCTRGILEADQCYEAFRAVGIDYGPAHRGIEKVYRGENRVLAKLSLPLSVFGTPDQFVLHPGMLDSALQASIGLILDPAALESASGKDRPGLVLPFALRELEIFSHCRPVMWAMIEVSGVGAAGDNEQTLDIDLCDEAGGVCVRLEGFSSRVSAGDIRAGEPREETVMLAPVWDIVPLVKSEVFPSAADRVVIIGGNGENQDAIRRYCPGACLVEIQGSDTIETIAQKLEMEVPGGIDHIFWAASPGSLEFLVDNILTAEPHQGIFRLFRLIKALLGMGYGARELGWTVITIGTQSIYKNEPLNPVHAGIHGLVGSMVKEYPRWRVRLIDLEPGVDWPLAEIFTLEPNPDGIPRVHRRGQWYNQHLIPINNKKLLRGVQGGGFLEKSPPGSKYKPGGVYIVIGGAGGIGEVWSEYMIRTYRARIAWIGRRQKDSEIRTKMDRLGVLGPAPHYISADAADVEALKRAYREIKQRYSRVDGVVHSAIVLLDRSLEKMEEEEFRAVYSTRADVSVNIARVFQRETLDFVLFFSSMQSFIKAPGQSNYASGCTYMDAFAHLLAREWPGAVKTMNWGYWGSVGVVASSDYRERMARAGVGSIEPPEAMEALEILLEAPMNQMALIKTTQPLVVE